MRLIRVLSDSSILLLIEISFTTNKKPFVSPRLFFNVVKLRYTGILSPLLVLKVDSYSCASPNPDFCSICLSSDLSETGRSALETKRFLSSGNSRKLSQMITRKSILIYAEKLIQLLCDLRILDNSSINSLLLLNRSLKCVLGRKFQVLDKGC